MGRGGVFRLQVRRCVGNEIPLSPALSPFVPHGEREWRSRAHQAPAAEFGSSIRHSSFVIRPAAQPPMNDQPPSQPSTPKKRGLGLADLCIQRPVFATMINLFLVVLGWFSFNS